MIDEAKAARTTMPRRRPHVRRLDIRRLGETVVAIAALLLAGAWTGTVRGEDIARQYHDWAGFDVGSWRQVRVVSESLDEEGEVVSTSMTQATETLVRRDDERITLQVDTVVEVGGKQFKAPLVIVDRGPLGERENETAAVEQLDDAKITVEGEVRHCHRHRVEITGQGQLRVVQVHWSEELSSVLRRVVTATDENNEVAFTSTEEVLTLDMPYRVLSEMKQVAHVRTIHKNHKSVTTTLAVRCRDVPGQVVAYSSKEVDTNGRVVRRSTMELVRYNAAVAAGERQTLGSRLKQRREERRQRRADELPDPS